MTNKIGGAKMKNWKNWLKAAGIRAVKTVAQTAVEPSEQLPYWAMWTG